MIKNPQVPILITWDVDPDRWTTLEKRQDALKKIMDACEDYGIKSTFFFTANYIHEYPDELARMRTFGHEVGCHGLTHTDEEEYDRMPEPMQREYIQEATKKVKAVVNDPLISFRSPRVKTSACTLRLLSENGYLADSSVCSQRVDLVSSNLVNTGWIYAPRKPYHPDPRHAFKRGDLPLWEVPVSAMVIPFISNALNVLGLPMMKVFFRLLYAESKRTGKPIVYLGHPTEFIPPSKLGQRRRHRPKLKEFSPGYIRTHGLLLRKVLYGMDGSAWLNATQELFAYMASFPDVEFVTIGQYTTTHLAKAP
jgi:peptidoglycan/xylan/chitin deacetylase (PgdA/CDA1 family)